jgi:hypothetical protein
VLGARRLLEPRHDGSYARTLAALALLGPAQAARTLRELLLPPLPRLAKIHGRPPVPALYLHWLTRPLRPLARAFGWRPARG